MKTREDITNIFKVGDLAYWFTPEPEMSGVYLIVAIGHNYVELTNGEMNERVPFDEVYAVSRLSCPVCGNTMYIEPGEDDYPFVCLDCGEILSTKNIRKLQNQL